MFSAYRAIVVLSLLCFAPTSRAALNIDFEVLYGQANGGQPTWGLGVFLTKSADILHYTYSSPGGQFIGDNIDGSVFHAYSPSSFAALRDAVSNSGPWTLTVVSSQDTSTYHFTPDLNSLHQPNFPIGQLTSPAPHQITPSFQIAWAAPTGIATFGYVSIQADPPVNGSFFKSMSPLGSTAGTWFPGTLSTGAPTNYFINLVYNAPSTTIPVSPELVSGPNIAFAETSSVDFQSDQFTQFTAIPEPASIGLILLTLTPIIGRRRAPGRSQSISKNKENTPGSNYAIRH